MKTHGSDQIAWRRSRRGAAWVRWLVIVAVLSSSAMGFVAVLRGKGPFFPFILALWLLWLWMIIGAILALIIGVRSQGLWGFFWGAAALLGALMSGAFLSVLIGIGEKSAPLFSLAFAIPFAIGAAGLTLFVLGFRRAQRKRQPDRCLSCDYDLHGTKLAGLSRCPECGAPISPPSN